MAKDEKCENYTPEQRAFVGFFIEQGLRRAGEAYSRAYPKCTTENSANVGASRLLKTPKIQALMREVLEESHGSVTDTLEYRLVREWIAQAFYDPADILDGDGNLVEDMKELQKKGLSVCIEQIDIRPDKDGVEHVVYKLVDRDKARDMLAKYSQLIKPPAQVNMNFQAGETSKMTVEEELLYQQQLKAIRGEK